MTPQKWRKSRGSNFANRRFCESENRVFRFFSCFFNDFWGFWNLTAYEKENGKNPILGGRFWVGCRPRKRQNPRISWGFLKTFYHIEGKTAKIRVFWCFWGFFGDFRGFWGILGHVIGGFWNTGFWTHDDGRIWICWDFLSAACTTIGSHDFTTLPTADLILDCTFGIAVFIATWIFGIATQQDFCESRLLLR